MTPRQPDRASRRGSTGANSGFSAKEKKMRAPRTGPYGPAPLIERLFCCAQNEERLSKDDRRRGAARRRGDRDPPDLARRFARAGPLAAEPLRPRVRPRGPRRLPRGRSAHPHDEHLGRQPRQAHDARVGGLAREDQPRGRARGARSRGRRARLRRRLDRPARRARQAVRLAAADAGTRALRGAGARCSSSRASTSCCSRPSEASSRRPRRCARCAGFPPRSRSSPR